MSLRRACLAAAALALTAVHAGCTWQNYALENIWYEPKEVHAQNHNEDHYRRIGRRRFEEIQTVAGCPAYSDAYAEGFEDGFADYVFAGGNGEPPAMIPRKYRQSKFDNPAGAAAIQEWIAGFRHGAQEGMASGLRVLVLRPVPRPPIDHPLEQNTRPIPAPTGYGEVPPEDTGGTPGIPLTAGGGLDGGRLLPVAPRPIGGGAVDPLGGVRDRLFPSGRVPLGVRN